MLRNGLGSALFTTRPRPIHDRGLLLVVEQASPARHFTREMQTGCRTALAENRTKLKDVAEMQQSPCIV